MSEDSKTVSEEEKALATPAEAEAKVHDAVEEVLPDGLLIEEDGDPFWVIQQVFWGILKTAALLGLLLFLIWLVWRPTSFLNNSDADEFVVEAPVVEKTESSEPKVSWWSRLFTREEEKSEVAPPSATIEVVPPSKLVNPNTPTSTQVNTDNVVQTAYQLETDRTVLVRGIIPESVKWLQRSKTVGEISMNMVREGTPQARSRQVEQILSEADLLFIESANLQAQLQSEIGYFSSKGSAANNEVDRLEQDIATTLQNLDPVVLENLVQQKIVAQKEASYFMSNAKIRDTLLRNIQTFDRLLRQQSIPLLNPATELRAS